MTALVPPHEAVVRRSMDWVATGVVLVNLPVAVVRSAAQPDAYRSGFAPAVLGVVGLLAMWSLTWCIRRRDARTPLRLIVLVACGALVLHLWLTGPAAASYPPLLHVLGAGMVVSALAGVRSSLVVIPAFAAVVALIRAPLIGAPDAVVEAILLAVSGLVGTACVELFRTASRSVRTTAEASWVLREESARRRQRAIERERWDGLIHDKVLGALRIASRAPGEPVPRPAQELAHEALAAFDGDPGAVPSCSDAWRRVADALGLTAVVDVSGELEEPEVRDAVVAAVAEAVTNVARHSGARWVEITGTLSPSGARVAVRDEGRGFDADPRAFGTGLRGSVVARMRSVGGEAVVRSVRGRGTVVLVVCEPVSQAVAQRTSTWQLETFTPMMVLGAIVLVANTVRGYEHWASMAPRALTLAGIGAIAVVTVAATFARPTARRWLPIVAVIELAVVAFAVAAPPSPTADWRYWYVGALTPAVAAAAYRFAPGVGLAVALLISASVVVVDAAAGRPPLASLTGPVPVLIGTSVGAHLMRRGMDDAWRRVDDAARRDGETRLAMAAADVRSEVARARVSSLEDSVGSVLRRMIDGGAVGRAEAEDLAVLEGSVRDLLVAPDLLDAALVDELERARSRGVRIDILGLDDLPEESPQDVAVAARLYRAVLLGLLPQLPTNARVRVAWTARPGDGRGSISAVADGLDRVTWDAPLEETPAGASVVVSQDVDSILVGLSVGGENAR